MATKIDILVEVYDHATGEHFTRPANAEELAYYKELEKELAQSNTETAQPTES
jgi:hypothetical protein